MGNGVKRDGIYSSVCEANTFRRERYNQNCISGVYTGSLIPEIMVRISKAYPKLQIELVQVLYENQQDFLRNYKIDLNITREMNSSQGILSENIYSDNLSIVVPENHPYQTIEDLNKETLQQQKFILPIKDEGSSYSDIIKQMFKTLDVEPDVFLHSEFGSTIIALVRKGLGIAILPDSYMYHESPGLRFIKLPFKTDLYLNWRADDHNPVLSNVMKLILSEERV